MKKEKKYVKIILVLLVILIVQLIYFSIRQKKQNSNQTDNSIPIENLVDKITIENIDVVLSDYSGQVTKDKLRESICLLAIKTIPEIGDETRDKSIAEIEKFYDEKKAMISSREIASKEDYVSIAEEINNYAPKGNLIYRRAKLQVVKDEEDDSDYYKLYLDIEYDRNIILKLKCYLSNNNNTIEFLSNSQVEQLFKVYKGSVTKSELYNTINEFKNSVQWIRENTKMVSINNQLKFYSENKDRFKKMGINTSEDFIKISTAMSNNVEWTNNTELNHYLISIESLQDNGNNSSIQIEYIYNYIEQLRLKMELSNDDVQVDKIRVTTMD